MLYIEDGAAAIGNSNLMDDGTDQIEVGAERKSWLDATLGDVFRKSFFVFELVFGLFVKMLVLVTLIYFVYSLVTVLPLAVAELIEIFSKDTP